jgi:hypothetical protein
MASFYSWRATATSDSAFNIDVDLWLKYADCLFLTNDGFICNSDGQQISGMTHSDNTNTFIFEIPYPVNIKDIFAKNRTAGYNATLVVIGCPLTRKEMLAMGVS